MSSPSPGIAAVAAPERAQPRPSLWSHLRDAVVSLPTRWKGGESITDQVLQGFCVVNLAVAALGLLLVALELQAQSVSVFYVAQAVIGGAVLYLTETGSRDHAATALLVGMFALAAAVLLAFGGPRTAHIAQFPLLIALASWLKGPRWAVLVTLASACLWIVAQLHDSPGPMPSSPAGHALFLALILLLALFIAVLSQRTYEAMLQEQRRTMRQLSRLSMAVDKAPSAVMMIDARGTVEYINAAQARALKAEPADITGKPLHQIAAERGLESHYRDVIGSLQQKGTWTGERSHRRADGSMAVESAYAFTFGPAGGEGSLVMAQDITRERMFEMHLEVVTNYDLVTGAMSDKALTERMRAAIVDGLRTGGAHALAVVNIRRLKAVNSAMGPEAVDTMLREACAGIQGILRSTDVIGRLSSADFGVLIKSVGDDHATAMQRARLIAAKIHAQVQTVRLPAPLDVPEQSPEGAGFASASIGLAMLPIGEGDTPRECVQRALSALLRAEENGGTNPTVIFDADLGARIADRYRIEHDLRIAIQDEQLRLFLQPQKVEGELIAAEALIRWEHPVRGLLAPFAFIPIAEDSGQIVPLERWVLRRVCSLIASLKPRAGQVKIAVNVSARHFREDDFVSFVGQCVRDAGIEPQALMLEITESIMVHEPDAVTAKMRELIDLGVRFALDDFGTGYSSLSYLRALPLHQLKIDRVFIQEAVRDTSQAAVVEAILGMAHSLGLSVVAEGVETVEQESFIKTRSPKAIIQGYLVSHPISEAQWRQLHDL